VTARSPRPIINSTLLRTLSSPTPRLLSTPGSDAFALAQQPEQEVFGADVVVIKALGFFLGKHEHATRPVSEAVKPVGSHRHPLGMASSPYHGIHRRAGVGMQYTRLAHALP